MSVRKSYLFVFTIAAVLLSVSVNVGYAFVGGAHGGFSGGYHGGSHSSSNSPPMSLAETLGFWAVLLGLICFCAFIGSCFEKTTLGKILKRARQKRYIARCRHTPVKAKKPYQREQINNALHILRQKAWERLKQWDSLNNMTESQLKDDVFQAFDMLQSGWSAQNTSRVLLACNNMRFSNKLVRQIDKMISLGVYNFIADTKITACHLVKCYKTPFFPKPILRFAIKGHQIDEYLIKGDSMKKSNLSRRRFNCLIDVIPYSNGFKVYQVKMKKHVDDYVMRAIV